MPQIDEEALAAAYNDALAAEKAGRLQDAEAGYRRCLALDPDDHGGAAVRLASMGIGETPERAPEAYVATLFDQHAEDFEDILVRQLGYGVPGLLGVRLGELVPGLFLRALDLGCGTGLAGEILRDRCAEIAGVDLSEKMVEAAHEKDVYDELFIGDAVGFLEECDEEAPWDLIVATDVLPYLGGLDGLFAGAARRLTGRGVFGFSSETLPDAMLPPQGFKVGAHQRFAHGEGYVRDRLGAHGFEILSLEPITVRLEQGEPVPGHLVIARKSS
ncbi:class I SAM-dependent DNA methyltransferase [Consotaella salsifontis]|uniref:Predicted methyltransferase, contains TPR repeat n=1 Tax=Consotaella salsifontis TaxID=1365950 RepID=A0A1T4PU78_9HYPH|nr:methyltransferase [Consotaella salsifontis]SJZ94866.1 Predicted methyltransferase, contains TPR repeat [Consotaella salsifontis]